MRTPRALAALLLPVVCLAAGCGGDGEQKNAYVDEVQAAQRDYVTRFETVRKQLKATSTLAQDRATLGDFSEATGKFVVALKGIDPPASVESEHADLTRAVVAYRAQVDKAREELRGGEGRAKQAAVRTDLSATFESAQTKIAQAIADINNGLRN